MNELYEIASRLLHYCPDSGIITRLSTGRQAGSPNAAGYLTVSIKGKNYYAHRIAYLLFYGDIPSGQVDHINGLKSDNRICNLRIATASQNKFNEGLRSTNTTGFKGVYWHKKAGKWSAGIRHNGKQIHLGLFIKKADAIKARKDKAMELHGEFYCE